ncbi:MAG: HpcH/HpaI aldolase family protein, partial [Phycisphaeraceae bacterium]
RVLLGLCNTYPAAGIIEGMCAGWDFVWIDGQHGQIDYQAAAHALRAAHVADVDTMLRTPGQEPGMLGQFADLAPSALMIPMVNTPAQAQQIVTALRFAPQGQRSYGGRRVIDLYGRDYYRQQELAIVAQIETEQAAQNAEAIIATDGIDLLFFGPDDMKLSLGLPIDTVPTENQRLSEAMRRTASAAKAAGKFACCVAADAATAQLAMEMGFQLMVGGADIAFLRTAAAGKLEELRGATRGGGQGGVTARTGSDIYGG